MPHMAQGYDSQQRNHRRPESPPPIRSYHQTMVLIPYSNLHQPHYSNTMDRSYTHAHAMAGDEKSHRCDFAFRNRWFDNDCFSGEQNGSHPYQHQSVNDQQPTLLKLSQAPQQLVGIPFPQAGVPMQVCKVWFNRNCLLEFEIIIIIVRFRSLVLHLRLILGQFLLARLPDTWFAIRKRWILIYNVYWYFIIFG